MISINKKITFSKKNPPIIVAEISGNHNGNKKRFLNLINSAYDNGADIVKIQTYEPGDITLNKKNNLFKIKKGIWKNKYLWDLYSQAHTPFLWHHEAFKLAKKKNKVLFSSPFSIRAVDFLEKFGVQIYKISSFEITDLKLIDYIASKKKPIILSTGMSKDLEISNAINVIKKYHNKIIILHCVSGYPTKLKDTDLSKINFLKKKFPKYKIGLSDHTNNIHSSIAAAALGVVMIEKHVKLDDKTKTADSEFSINLNKLKKLKKITIDIFNSTHKRNLITNLSEKNKNLRRSIFAKKDIKKDEKINEKNIVCLRPNIGICASKYFFVLGKRVNKDIKKRHPIFQKQIK